MLTRFLGDIRPYFVEGDLRIFEQAGRALDGQLVVLDGDDEGQAQLVEVCQDFTVLGDEQKEDFPWSIELEGQRRGLEARGRGRC